MERLKVLKIKNLYKQPFFLYLNVFFSVETIHSRYTWFLSKYRVSVVGYESSTSDKSL